MDWSWFWGLKVFSPPPADCTGIHVGSVVITAKKSLEINDSLIPYKDSKKYEKVNFYVTKLLTFTNT